MNPNDNQLPAEPADYLNQIAPQTVKRSDIFKNKPIAFGAIAIVALIIIIAIGSILSGGTKPAEQLAARLTSTDVVSEGAGSKIQSSQLLSFNSNLNIYLLNTIRDITPILAKENIDIKKLSSATTSAESNTAMLNRLEDARLNGVYDRTYAREMAYQLDTILTLMKQIYNSTGDSSLKTFLSNAYTNLAPTQKQFADFNAADS
jgi:hypothetical protein